MNVRIRTERHGKVALTMGAVVLTMPADEARALARAILHHADEADPVRRDRAFGEVLAPDVQAADPSRLDAASRSRLSDLNHDLMRALQGGDQRRLAIVIRTAEEAGFDLRPGAAEFTPIGQAPTNRATGAGI